MTELDRVLRALAALRAPQVAQEAELQLAVAVCLTDSAIAYRREAVLGRGCRIDFLTDAGIGIELKKGRPGSRSLRGQLERYAASEAVKALVVLTQKSALLPERIGGKACVQLSLNRLWGVAL